MRNHLEPPEVIIGNSSRASEDALTAASIEELLGIEGAAASQYFQQFNGMVKVEDDLPGLGLSCENTKQRMFNFNFNNRNPGVRPPIPSTRCFRWPTACWRKIAHWRRWPWVSILTWDSTISALWTARVGVGFDGGVQAARRGVHGVELHQQSRRHGQRFRESRSGGEPPAPGRKRFFQTYEQRMSSLITHPLFDYKISYRRALELQARLLAKTLTGEIAEYIPLMTR